MIFVAQLDYVEDLLELYVRRRDIEMDDENEYELYECAVM